ncbi:hypothetical protein TIFTF001_014492 [Ficus carica]|uniref:Uncharacterized protein n=1 Tax=Ficus carica TaxID=3494 RepID=A0AA88D881_FICCA|nr:hypothetical protein TIFTF001_014492 [Ficus carica]
MTETLKYEVYGAVLRSLLHLLPLSPRIVHYDCPHQCYEALANDGVAKGFECLLSTAMQLPFRPPVRRQGSRILTVTRSTVMFDKLRTRCHDR